MDGKDKESQVEFKIKAAFAESVVYFFEAVGTGLVKIGFSTRPVQRLLEIRTCCPFPVRAIAISPGASDREREFHDIYRQERINREWFGLHEGHRLTLAGNRFNHPEIWQAFSSACRSIGVWDACVPYTEESFPSCWNHPLHLDKRHRTEAIHA